MFPLSHTLSKWGADSKGLQGSYEKHQDSKLGPMTIVPLRPQAGDIFKPLPERNLLKSEVTGCRNCLVAEPCLLPASPSVSSSLA